jgi:hypothetical protein
MHKLVQRIVGVRTTTKQQSFTCHPINTNIEPATSCYRYLLISSQQSLSFMQVKMSKQEKKDDDSASERQPSLSDDTNADESKASGRKRTIDESHLDPEEIKKLESRRAYNRQCAAKGMWMMMIALSIFRASHACS